MAGFEGMLHAVLHDRFRQFLQQAVPLGTCGKLLPEVLQYMMGDDACLYNSRNTDGDNRNTHGLCCNTGTGVADSGAWCNTASADLNCCSDAADISGSQSIDCDKQSRFCYL